MSTVTQSQSKSKDASQSRRYSEMNSQSFNDETQKVFEAIEEVRGIISRHVRDGNIQPVDAWRGLSAFTANVLGYEEAVPRSTSGSLLPTLFEGLSGKGSSNS